MERQILLAISLLLGFVTTSNGQRFNRKNSVQLGVDYLTIGEFGYRTTFRLARLVAKDRLMIVGTAGYGKEVYRNDFLAFHGIKLKPARIVMAELGILYDFVKGPDTAIRLGGGPAAWSTFRESSTGLQFDDRNDPNTTKSVSIKRETVFQINYNITAECEVSLYRNVPAFVRVSIYPIQGKESVYAAGFGMGYQF